MVKNLLYINQPNKVVRKASDVSAADWRYQTREKISYSFHVCYNGFFQGLKSLYNTAGYMINEFLT